jgi:hypothetical protein
MPTGGLAGVAGGPPLGELDTNQLLKQLEQQLAVGKIHEPQARCAGQGGVAGMQVPFAPNQWFALACCANTDSWCGCQDTGCCGRLNV